jgi:outer membrane protein TolC
MNWVMRFIYSGIALVSFWPCFGQGGTVRLEQCQELARQNFPLIRQFDLISRTAAYSLENASKGYYPQVNFLGQASYQSAVTRLPISIPGIDVPTVSKDQYKLYAELNQVIYDAGTVKVQRKIVEAGAAVDKESLEVELYKLKDRVNQLYFSVLIIDRQLQQNRNVQSDLELGVAKINALIQNGTAFKSNADAIKAELLRSKQQAIELASAKNAYLEMLVQFTKVNMDLSTTFVIPLEPLMFEEIKRPELQLFDRQNQLLSAHSDQLGVRNLPKLNLFFQGGYGRPALNMLSNEFAPYYLGGIRLSWSLSSLYTYKKELALLGVRREQINLQRETFLFNTSLVMKQQQAEIQKYKAVLLTDQEIIGLRTNVKKASSAQLENGVITANDYLHEVNAEDQARQNMILHEMQLLMALYSQQITKGN